MKKNNYFILTGAMGGGKSAVIKKLRERQFMCVDEPARQILKEQRSIDGDGVPEKSPELFIQLMLSRSIHEYKINSNYENVIVFDRGIPDLIAYAEWSGISNSVYMKAARVYSYNKKVFMFNGWEKIYTTDDERKMDFGSAKRFGVNVSGIYNRLGYEAIDVPFLSEEERVEFIIDFII